MSIIPIVELPLGLLLLFFGVLLFSLATAIIALLADY
jgi:hypothetical protein